MEYTLTTINSNQGQEKIWAELANAATLLIIVTLMIFFCRTKIWVTFDCEEEIHEVQWTTLEENFDLPIGSYS